MTETLDEKIKRFEKNAAEHHKQVNKFIAERDPLRSYRYNEKRIEIVNRLQLEQYEIHRLEELKRERLRKAQQLEEQIKKLDSDYENYEPI